jgi:superfamily I DNA/RNA helicase
VRKRSGQFDPAADSVKVMTLHASKGLEFPVVALVGIGHMPTPGHDERDEARLFYVGATRSTQRLVIGAGGAGKFAKAIAA